MWAKISFKLKSVSKEICFSKDDTKRIRGALDHFSEKTDISRTGSSSILEMKSNSTQGLTSFFNFWCTKCWLPDHQCPKVKSSCHQWPNGMIVTNLTKQGNLSVRVRRSPEGEDHSKDFLLTRDSQRPNTGDDNTNWPKHPIKHADHVQVMCQSTHFFDFDCLLCFFFSLWRLFFVTEHQYLEMDTLDSSVSLKGHAWSGNSS